jgi:predicted Zn-dependent protease
MYRSLVLWVALIVAPIIGTGCSVLEGSGSEDYRSSILTALVWPEPGNIMVYMAPTLAGSGEAVAEADREAIRNGFRAWTNGLSGMAVAFVTTESEADIVVRFAVSSPGVTIARTTVSPASSTEIAKVTMLFLVNPAPHDLDLTCLHEIGRALGMVDGRSPYAFDVMSGQPNLTPAPSERDLETLRVIYREQGLEI